MSGIITNKVFISRVVMPESDIRQLLEPHGFEVEGRSLVAFEAVPFTLSGPFDWVFFYSKQGIQFFFDQVTKAGIVLPPSTRFAAIGPGTASLLKIAHFTGDGVPETTAKAFGVVAAGKRVVFARAADSRQSVQALLADVVEVVDLVVYHNQPIQAPVLSEAAILIFTSPLNAQAYFSTHGLLPGQKTLAIGQTTARALSEMNIAPIGIAAHPSENAIAELVLSMEKAHK
ncbi:MAG: uroporphyrinogen-III synthase [Saprospiraceae bacterium]|nr:uroporphyrinogen-III synthase [Saprospiraceae bacterium]